MTLSPDFHHQTLPTEQPHSGEPRHTMHGFEPQYANIVDYILGITHKIWEEKAVGYIYDTYQHDCLIHLSGGQVIGNEEVVAGTLQTLAAFPDRKLFGLDVIWAGDDEAGFATSHLIMSVAHNTGHSAYGPPTGRKVVWRAIADCRVKANRIYEEWLLRDETHLIRQLGLDVNEIAEQQVRAQLPAHLMPQPSGDLFRAPGQRPPIEWATTAGQFDVEDFVRRSYHEIWNRRMLNAIRRDYAESFVGHTSGGRRLVGQSDATQFVLTMLGMFPDGEMTVDEVYSNEDEKKGCRAAVRWTFVGTHRGPGIYGEPGGGRVQIMGLSQHRIYKGRFVEEHTVFDEFGLIKQIIAHRLAGG